MTSLEIFIRDREDGYLVNISLVVRENNTQSSKILSPWQDEFELEVLNVLLGELPDISDGDDGAALDVQVGVVLAVRQPRRLVGSVHLSHLK